MLVEVAEAGTLPTAEGVVGDRDGDRHVHADHAGVHPAGEVAGGVAVPGEDRDTASVDVLAGQPQGLLVVRGADHGQDRPEDLLLVDAHRGGDPVEQGGTSEEAVLVPGQDEVPSVDDEFRALLDTEVDVAANPVDGVPSDQRAEVRLGVVTAADPQRADALLQTGDQSVGGVLADRDGDGDRHTALPRRAVPGADQGVHGLVEVGVRHHDHVVLGAAEALGALAVGRGGGVDVRGDRGGADEAERADAGVFEEGVDALLAAVDDVQDARRQARLQEEFGEPQRYGRVALGGLEDEGVAAGQRGSRLPQGDHRGEVERGDAGHHTDRGAHGVDVDAGAGVVGELPLQQMRDPGGELHHFQAALDVAVCVGDRLAVLGGEQPGQRVPLALDELEEAEEDAGTALRIPLAPLALRRRGVGDRRLGLSAVGERDMGLHLARVGVVDVAVGPRCSRSVLAADEMAQLTHGGAVVFTDHGCLLSSGGIPGMARRPTAHTGRALCVRGSRETAWGREGSFRPRGSRQRVPEPRDARDSTSVPRDA